MIEYIQAICNLVIIIFMGTLGADYLENLYYYLKKKYHESRKEK